MIFLPSNLDTRSHNLFAFFALVPKLGKSVHLSTSAGRQVNKLLYKQVPIYGLDSVSIGRETDPTYKA